MNSEDYYKNDEEKIDQEVLDKWAKDVIEWTIEELENGRINPVINRLEEVVSALVVEVRPKYRNQIIRLVKALFKLFGGR